jgi:hypothetical protein
MLTYPAYGVPATILLFMNIFVHLSFDQLYPQTVIPARLSIAMFEDIAVTTNLSLIFAITEYLTVIFEAI